MTHNSTKPMSKARAPIAEGVPVSKRLRLGHLENYSGVVILIALIVVFSLAHPDLFPTVQNLRVTVANSAIALLLALALVVPFAAGVFDISVAANMGLAVVLVGLLQSNGLNAGLAVLVTLLVGAVIGLLNAVTILRFRVPSIIATLGMASILGALAYWVTDGRSIVRGQSDAFLRIGQSSPLGIPSPVVYGFALAIAMHLFLEHTPLGRRLYASGGNAVAARLAGLPVIRHKGGALVATGILAAFTGVVLASRLGTSPLHAGDPYLLSSFAALFLGATQYRVGRFNVVGTVIAVMLIAVGVKGLELTFPNNAWIKEFFEGSALIIAVALAVRRRELSGLLH